MMPPRMKISHPNCKNEPEQCRITMVVEVVSGMDYKPPQQQVYNGYGQPTIKPAIPKNLYECETCGAKWKSHYDAEQQPVIESVKEPS